MSGYGRLFRPATYVLGLGLANEWIHSQIGEVVPVRGASMQPVLNPAYQGSDVADPGRVSGHQDRVFVRRLNESHASLHHGDVVTCVDPHDRRQVLIKRVIGLPGDVVETLRYSQRFCRIPEGHCWIEGDNQADSIDSNDFGPVPLGLLRGKALAVVRPWNRMQWLDHQLGAERDRGVRAEAALWDKTRSF